MPRDLLGLRARIGVNPQDTQNYVCRIVTDDATNPQNLVLEYYNGSANAPTQDFRKARGTVAAPGDAAIGDRIIDIRSLARAGTAGFTFGAALRTYVDDVAGGLVANQAPPMKMVFQTCLMNTAATEQATLWSTGQWSIGADLVAAGLAANLDLFHVAKNGLFRMRIQRSSTDANACSFAFYKTRGTIAAPSILALNDSIGELEWRVHDGTNADQETAQISAAVDAAPVNGQRPATRIGFFTNLNNAAQVLQMNMRQDGMLYVGDQIAAMAYQPTSFPTDGHLFAFDPNGPTRHIYLVRASTTNGHNIGFFRARGTLGALANVVDGDRITRIESNSFSGATGFWANARIDMEVDGAVVDNQRPGSNIKFFSNIANTAVAERMRLNPDGVLNHTPNTGATAGGSLVSAFTFGTNPGVIGIYWGSGAPTISAPKGSLYLRTDGSATNNRAYIATNGTGTWTAITTVA
jgi:hypothetical protein